MKKVIVFGTFDIFHKGHMDFFRQARKYGDFLIVVIARDKIVSRIKGKKPRNNEKKRQQTIKDSKMADKVVLGNLHDMYAAIKKYRPDVICLGYDQSAFIDKLAEKLFSFDLKNVKIKRLKSYFPGKYKSSKL